MCLLRSCSDFFLSRKKKNIYKVLWCYFRMQCCSPRDRSWSWEHLHVVSVLTLFGLVLVLVSDGLEGIPQTRPAGPGAPRSPRATKKKHQLKKKKKRDKVFCPPFSQLLSELSQSFSKWGGHQGAQQKYISTKIYKSISYDCLPVKNVVHGIVSVHDKCWFAPFSKVICCSS